MNTIVNFELRQVDDGFEGTVVRYDDEAQVHGLSERFVPGSIKFDDVILNLMHDRSQPVARTGTEFMSISDAPEALTLKVKYPPTDYGRRAKELITAGVLRGLSAEFRVAKDTMAGQKRTIQEATLYGVGIVDRPAYPESTLQVRDKKRGRRLWQF